jgi:hypothetical protein
MKKLAIVLSIAAVVGLSSIKPQPASAQSQQQINNFLAQRAYYNSLRNNQNINYGGATVFPNGTFTNNGVSWNGADPAGGRGPGSRVFGQAPMTPQLANPRPGWEGWQGHFNPAQAHAEWNNRAGSSWTGWQSHGHINNQRQAQIREDEMMRHQHRDR